MSVENTVHVVRTHKKLPNTPNEVNSRLELSTHNNGVHAYNEARTAGLKK